jgi:hypothetical protein
MNAFREGGLAVGCAPAPDAALIAGTGRRPWRRLWLAVAVLLLGAGLAAPARAASTAEEQAAIDQVNLRRQQVGLPALSYNPNLEQSSRGHANYLAVNDTTGHFQSSTAPGFTGVDPFARISATPYGAPFSSNEVIAFGPLGGADGVEGLIQAIYHRFGVFSSSVNEIGTGFNTSHLAFTPPNVLVVNAAATGAVPPLPAWVGLYPFDGQTGVTRDFYSDTESPDPVAGANRVGYPISIHVDESRALVVTSFTVTPVSPPGPALATTLLDNVTDASGFTPAWAAAVIPTAPLAYGTEYEVSFTGTAGGDPLTRTWRFTTVPLLPITFSPAQPYLAYNSTLDIQISGGSGVYGANISFFPPKPADLAFTGPSTIRLTSPAASVGAPVTGSVTLTVTDDEGHSAQVVVQVQPTVDPVPDAFAFSPVTGAAQSTVVQSGPITVAGINAPAPVSIAGGEYSINGGAFAAAAGTVVNGDQVSVRLTSAATEATLATATLTIGGVSAAFNVTTGGGASFSANLEAGFNLIGNSLNIMIDVAATFGNQDAPTALTPDIVTIWMWNALDGRWMFYSPQLPVAGIASFAASKGYDVLAAIQPGQGYWVNALAPVTLPAQTGTPYNWDATTFPGLAPGFNLIAQANSVTPSQFNLDVTPGTPSGVPTDNFLSLWAWDAAAAKWYFHSPLLESTVGLPGVKAYADAHFYLDFQDNGKLLGLGVGFWVNRP